MFKETIPYFPRGENIPPPGRVDVYGLLNSVESFALLEKATEKGLLSPGTRDLAMGLWRLGGVKKFPGGDGLLYDNVFKNIFITKLAIKACREISQQIKKYTDVILAPEHSAIIIAGIIATFLKVPIVKINKNGIVVDAFTAQADSYTGGERDTLSIGKNSAAELFQIEGINSGEDLRATLFDDILDTGTISLTTASIVEQIHKAGHPIKLTGIAALFEKGYTKARERLQRELKINPVSGLVIEDLGMIPQQWMKIRGVPMALSFKGPNDTHH